MEEMNNEENNIKKIYGKEDLKEILTNLLEKMFVENMKDIEN